MYCCYHCEPLLVWLWVYLLLLFLLLLFLFLLWFLLPFLSTFHPLHGSIEDSMARMNAEHFGKHVASWCMKNGHIFQQTYCIQWDCPWYTHFQGFAAFLADRLMCHTNPYKDIDGIFADAAADPWPLDSHGRQRPYHSRKAKCKNDPRLLMV